MRSDTKPGPRKGRRQFEIDDVATHEILEGLARLHSHIAVSDLEGRVLWLSDALAEACGGATRHVGRELCDAFAALPGAGAREKARIREQIAHIRGHLRANETIYDVRLELGRGPGGPRSVDVSAFRTDTQSGDPLVVTIVHPSDQRSLADSALRDERDDLAGIVAACPDPVLALDRFGFIVQANAAAADLLDLDLEKLLDSPIAMLVPRSPELVAVLSEVRPGDDLRDHPLEIERTDGRKLDAVARVRAHESSRHIEKIVFLRDTSEQVAMLRAKERKNAELEAYVHSVSHDLRSPLVSLLGFARLLHQDYGHKLDDTGRHFVDRIEQAARTMRALIDDLLEISQIGSRGERREYVDPRSVLLQLKAELKLRLDAAGARLEIPENPPLLLCDRTRLYQLFSNLVGNALQHMGDCSDPTIVVEIVRKSGEDVIVVSDRGQGIETSELGRIFDVFYSKSRSKAEHGSTGVGLAIVRKIAETHGGRAWAESEPGHGASFYVALPNRS